ncbi:hypothetical protein NDN08_004171 [Rhodosorus marinus]|uniref:Uncharacterized protein n=1 Tax=Rhodosorus marinus TaxID=101924 RepID=A0AAV8UHJ6_9RHOD|nr:hypothetical protein NDN08_004171 [Rhodosorus marinus]
MSSKVQGSDEMVPILPPGITEVLLALDSWNLCNNVSFEKLFSQRSKGTDLEGTLFQGLGISAVELAALLEKIKIQYFLSSTPRSTK